MGGKLDRHKPPREASDSRTNVITKASLPAAGGYAAKPKIKEKEEEEESERSLHSHEEEEIECRETEGAKTGRADGTSYSGGTTTSNDANRMQLFPSSAKATSGSKGGGGGDHSSAVSVAITRPHYQKALEEQGGLMLKFLLSPFWQYLTLGFILALYFVPVYPRLVSFMQGFLLTLFVSEFAFVWYFGKFMAAEKKEQLRRAEAFVHPEVNAENIEFRPKAKWEESVCMNIWPQDREPYSEATFNVRDTKSVRVTLDKVHLRVDHLTARLPPQRVYNEKVTGNQLRVAEMGERIPLRSVNVFLSPEGLPQTRWFYRKYPIVVQSCNKAVDDTSNYFYLFARTNRDKEIWYNKLYDAVAVAKGIKTRTHDENFRVYMHNMYSDIMRGEMKEDFRLLMINKLFARAWYNLQTSRPFNHYMRMKLTKNLRKLKLAKYFKHVGIQELKFGDKFPFITSIQDLIQDEWGLWIDVDMDYVGRSLATVRTRGIRIPAKALKDYKVSKAGAANSGAATKESSSKKEGTSRREEKKSGVQSEVQKFLVKFLVDMPWVKNTIGKRPIMLHLCLKRLRGRVVLNLPAPPTDRLWYGFRHPPEMDVEISPCLGECSKDQGQIKMEGLSDLEKGVLGHLMTAMEERMKLETEKNWVYPNMGNLVIPYFKVPPWLQVRKPPPLQT